jgi:hypothetical protein
MTFIPMACQNLKHFTLHVSIVRITKAFIIYLSLNILISKDDCNPYLNVEA